MLKLKLTAVTVAMLFGPLAAEALARSSWS
jgi:hypothetical protein